MNHPRRSKSIAAALSFFVPVLAACSSSSGPISSESPDSGSTASADAASSDGDTFPSEGGPSGPDAAATQTDCTKAQNFCISAAVVRNGKRVSCVAMSLGAGRLSRILVPTPTWSIACDDAAMELTALVEFPVQAAGTFDFSTTPGATSSIQFSATAYDSAQGTATGAMTETSTNLVSARLTGNVDASMTGTGTLTASWGTPGASCQSGDLGSDPCAPGSMVFTFHVMLPQ